MDGGDGLREPDTRRYHPSGPHAMPYGIVVQLCRACHKCTLGSTWLWICRLLQIRVLWIQVPVDLFVIIVYYYDSRLNSPTNNLRVFYLFFCLGLTWICEDLDSWRTWSCGSKTRRFPMGGLAGTCRSGWTHGMPYSYVTKSNMQLSPFCHNYMDWLVYWKIWSTVI